MLTLLFLFLGTVWLMMGLPEPVRRPRPRFAS